jgi:3,4-dihydroxy 2-butanone 4-phosphate synthase/GTP cyclohydrolase II
MINFIEHKLKLSELQTVRSLVEDVEDRPACALIFGENVVDGCLVRVHSSCLYGDVFRACDCDCGNQLVQSIDIIQKEGSGVIIYLDQEGRGYGLANKAKGTLLTQTKKIDTFEAYSALGLEKDVREYSTAVRILRYLGLNSVRLLTNDPLKVSALESAGIHVKRIPVTIPPTVDTKDYLLAKKKKGHLLNYND